MFMYVYSGVLGARGENECMSKEDRLNEEGEGDIQYENRGYRGYRRHR